jgi:hypothetical protein
MKRVLRAKDLKSLSREELRAMSAEPSVSEFERTILLRELFGRDTAAARQAAMKEGCEGLPEDEAFVCEVRNTLRILMDEFHEGRTTAAKAAWELANLTGIPYLYTSAVISMSVDVEHIEDKFDAGELNRADADTRLGLLNQDHLTVYRIVRHGNAEDIRNFGANPGNYVTTKKSQKASKATETISREKMFQDTFNTVLATALSRNMPNNEATREIVTAVVKKVVDDHFSR